MAGAVLLLAGAVLQITRWELAPYLYTLGAVMFGYVQVMGNRYDGRNLSSSVCVDSRFRAVALVFTGVLMFTMKRNEWIVCLSIAAVLELYTAFRIPQELEKENVKKPVSFLVRVYRGLSCENRRTRTTLVTCGPRLINSCPVLLFHNGHFIYQVFRSCKLINNK